MHECFFNKYNPQKSGQAKHLRVKHLILGVTFGIDSSINVYLSNSHPL